MVANITTTHKCNLRCKHCYYIDKLLLDDGAVAFENWCVLESKREELAIDKYNFTGGETTLCSNLMSYFSDCKRNDIEFSMFTNGIDISSSIIDCCNEFFVSVDGVGRIHDSVRNRDGAYERTLMTLQKMKNSGKKIHIQTTASRINIEHLNPVIEMYAKLLPELKSISLVAAVNQGNTFNNCISLNKSELIKVKNFKEKVLEKLHYQVFVKDNLFTLDQLREFVLSDKSVFPVWIDLISGEVYVVTDEYKTDIKNLSVEWINEQYQMIRKKISKRVMHKESEFYIIEELL